MQLEHYELEELKFKIKVIQRAIGDLDQYFEQLEYWEKQQKEKSGNKRKNRARKTKR